jgi:hypothetical protein
MPSDWFNEIKILQGRWQHGEKVGYCQPSGLEKTLCKWDIVYVPLVMKGLKVKTLGVSAAVCPSVIRQKQKLDNLCCWWISDSSSS